MSAASCNRVLNASSVLLTLRPKTVVIDKKRINRVYQVEAMTRL